MRPAHRKPALGLCVPGQAGKRERLLGQRPEDMGAVCVDAAPVRLMGIHAASAEMLTASRYDKLDVLGAPAQAVHSSWQVRVAIASCRGDRKSVMHRTASASRSWELVASMRSAGVLKGEHGRAATSRADVCRGKSANAADVAACACGIPSLPSPTPFTTTTASRPLDCTRSLGHALGHSALQVRMASSATATQTEVSEAQSVMLMRNLMRVTFSNVVYTRGIFDSSQFKPMNARIACHEWLA